MIESHRVVQPEPTPPSRRNTVSCSVCSKATTGGKPYCARHVEQMPYVAQLSARLARRRGRKGDAA